MIISQKFDVGRPLVHGVLFYIAGIVCANQFLEKQYVFLVMPIMSLFIMGYIFYFGIFQGIYALICLVIGIVALSGSLVIKEGHAFIPKQCYTLKGEVQEISITPYYQWVTLNHVEQDQPQQKLKSKVQIRLQSNQEISLYDEVTVKAECLEMTPQMNPSDFDTITYLRGKGVVATFKVEQLVHLVPHTPLVERIREACILQLEKLFSSHKVGIIEAALLGDDSRLDETTYAIYQKAGISHVLCISGFHVGVVTGLFMLIGSYLPISYAFRQITMMVAIIFYAYLTGASPSTVRATIMVAVGLLGKCLWQEQDRLTNWAIAAGGILISNPYQLFMVGVQLSFMAVLGVTVALEEMEKKERFSEWKYGKLMRTLLVWLSVQLFTSPILAYHFYEIPFLVSTINLVVIPIFSMIIISSWWILGLSFLPGCFQLARVGSGYIESILSMIEELTKLLLNCPLATWCTGKPNLFEITLYVIGVFLVGCMIWGYLSKKEIYQSMAVLAAVFMLNGIMQPKNLKMNGLYIGQGDCCVIEMPRQGLLIVDGGPFGKGKTVEKYVKYLGYSKIQGMMVSHSDADHIGGILELLETSLKIERLFVSCTDQSEHLEELIKTCNKKKIPVTYLGAGDCVTYDQLQLMCFAPTRSVHYENNNDNSIVCKLSYGDFSALLTGDQSKGINNRIYDEIGPISLLKVSHHGSRTGTSLGMLLKLQPRYAMISCGTHNRYGHPHQEVTQLLEDEEVMVSRTDKEGTIIYETDGRYLKKTSYRKDA